MIPEHLKDLLILQFDLLKNNSLTHFVTTRSGGISKGNYTSLNMGNLSDDVAQHVHENRKRLAAAIEIQPESLFIPQQTHDERICIVDEHFLSLSATDRDNALQGVDALVTALPHMAIGVTTADCVPVLLFDPVRKVFAAVHAGWKGTTLRLASKTLTVMQKTFGSNASDILVGIGPSISPERFEVGDEVGQAFTKVGFNLASISFRDRQTGKLHINLWEANRIQLIESGVLPANIEMAECCTYTHSDRFFSARRQTVHSGRMLSGGMLIG